MAAPTVDRSLFWSALSHQHDGRHRRGGRGAGADLPGRARELPPPPRGQERRLGWPGMRPADGGAAGATGGALHPRADDPRRQGVEPARGGGGGPRARPGRSLDRVPRSAAGSVGYSGTAGAQADADRPACQGDRDSSTEHLRHPGRGAPPASEESPVVACSSRGVRSRITVGAKHQVTERRSRGLCCLSLSRVGIEHRFARW